MPRYDAYVSAHSSARRRFNYHFFRQNNSCFSQGISTDRNCVYSQFSRSIRLAPASETQTSARSSFASLSLNIKPEGKLQTKLIFKTPCTSAFPLPPLLQAEKINREAICESARKRAKLRAGRHFFSTPASPRGGFRLPETVPTISRLSLKL